MLRKIGINVLVFGKYCCHFLFKLQNCVYVKNNGIAMQKSCTPPRTLRIARKRPECSGRFRVGRLNYLSRPEVSGREI